MRNRSACTNSVCHVLNRSAKRLPLFRDAGDYQAFIDVLAEAQLRRPVPLLAFCVMPTHFHLVLWPPAAKDLSRFGHWLTVTHAQRWQRARGSAGSGAVYQGRFKAIPVQTDSHLLTVLRYVERNPVRAGLVARAENWPWSSACRGAATSAVVLANWPVDRPGDWLARINEPEGDAELHELRRAVTRDLPVGTNEWAKSLTQPRTAHPTSEAPSKPTEPPVPVSAWGW